MTVIPKEKTCWALFIWEALFGLTEGVKIIPIYLRFRLDFFLILLLILFKTLIKFSLALHKWPFHDVHIKKENPKQLWGTHSGIKKGNLPRTKMPDRRINELQKVHHCFVNPPTQTMNIPDKTQS